jgi:hypothetical protein
LTTGQPKIKPSRWFYVLGFAVLVVGPIVFSIFLFSSLLSNVSSLTQMPSIQVIVPGASDIILSETGKYTIFYEYQSVVGNRVFSTTIFQFQPFLKYSRPDMIPKCANPIVVITSMTGAATRSVIACDDITVGYTLKANSLPVTHK